LTHGVGTRTQPVLYKKEEKFVAEKTLVCKDCGAEFVFTEGEQEFYSQKGFSDPMRCPECRKARKQQRYESN